MMTGRLVDTLYTPHPVVTCAVVTTPQTSTRLLILGDNGDLVSYRITNVPSTQTPHTDGDNGGIENTTTLFTTDRRECTAMTACRMSPVVCVVCSTGQVIGVHSVTLHTVYDIHVGCHLSLSSCYLDNADNVYVLDDKHTAWVRVDSKGEKGKITVKSELPINGLYSCQGTRVAMATGPDEFRIVESRTGDIVLSHTLSGGGKRMTIDRMALTPDGKYIIVVCVRNVLLIRVQDGRLLSNVTLDDVISSVHVTRDSWFVLLGLATRGLTILLISDPQVKGHEERVRVTRHHNPGLPVEKAKYLADLCFNNSQNFSRKSYPQLYLVRSRFVDMEEGDGEGELDWSGCGITRAAQTRDIHNSNPGDGARTGAETSSTTVTRRLCTLQ